MLFSRSTPFTKGIKKEKTRKIFSKKKIFFGMMQHAEKTVL